MPTMTVEETLRFAFDSMAGGSHIAHIGGVDSGLSDEQKELVAWMDEKHFKVMTATAQYIAHLSVGPPHARV